MQRCNFHTHTKYSDGTDTPREMIEAAIGFGFKAPDFHGFPLSDRQRIDHIVPLSRYGTCSCKR